MFSAKPESSVVWVARPAAQAGALIELLQASGCRVLAWPVLEICELAESSAAARAARAVLAAVPDCDHLLFVSANAARIGLASLLRHHCLPGPATRIYAVGPSSAQFIEGVVGPVLLPQSDYTSEGLLQLPELQVVAGQSVIIIRGVGGRPKLADELTRRGAVVKMAELYQRVSASHIDKELDLELRAGRIDAIMAASGETIRHLLELVGTAQTSVRQTVLVVPGERVADLARDAGFANIVVAQSALSEHMAAAWNQYRRRKG